MKVEITMNLKEFSKTFLGVEVVEIGNERGNVSIGDEIRIDNMVGEPQYTGKVGKVTDIDDMGQIHGTWGGCALFQGDKFTIIK